MVADDLQIRMMPVQLVGKRSESFAKKLRKYRNLMALEVSEDNFRYVRESAVAH